MSQAKSLDCTAMTGWSIVLATDATPSERYAAEELQTWFARRTGLRLPVHTGLEAAPGQVRLSAAGNADLGEEGYHIDVQPDAVSVTGGRPRGILYGVYHLLEELLGLRFLTSDHTFVPDDEPAHLPLGACSYTPPFSFRWSAYLENTRHPELAARLRVNTVSDAEHLGGRTPQNLINHSVHAQMPYERYGAEHPEYYALVDGVRDTDPRGGGPQLCVTNPDVIRLTGDTVLEQLAADPGQTNISVSQADTDRYCRCDACEAVTQAEGTPMGPQLALVNAVAERVAVAHPHVKVGTLAYWYTRKPPKTIRPRANVQIQLCSIECCTLHAIDDPDCAKNREFCDDMQIWGAMCDDIWVWNYNTNFRSYDLPFPNLRVIGPNLRFFRRHNTHGLFMQADHNGMGGELCDLRNYLIARLLWNPDADDGQLCEEFVRLHYGTAAGPVLDYLRFLHDNAESRGLHPACFPTPEEVGLDAEVARRALAFFDTAIEAADSDAVRRRVEKASIAALKAVLVTGDAQDDGRREIIDRYVSLSRSHGVTHTSEGQTAEEYFAQLV